MVVDVPSSPEIIMVSSDEEGEDPEKEANPEEKEDPEEEEGPEEDEGEVDMADVKNASGEEDNDPSDPDYDPLLDR